MTMIVGKVRPGRGLGKMLGFPTLNIDYDGELSGVYVAKIFLDDVWKKAAVHIGKKPTINEYEVFCEACVVDWEGEAPRSEVKVELIEKIREVQKFSSLKELTERIAKDMEFARMFPC